MRDVYPLTLDERVNGAVSAEVKYQRSQRLTPEEEMAIERWILRLQAWGCPPRVEQTRFLVKELLEKKSNLKPLGVSYCGATQISNLPISLHSIKNVLWLRNQIFSAVGSSSL